MNNLKKHGTILFAHGSRDPLWRKPIEAVASRITELAPMVHVRCAYLELSTPDILASADELISLGINELTVLPLFLGVGKHAREDLPMLIAALRAKHPLVQINLRPAVGEDAQMIDLMARIALT